MQTIAVIGASGAIGGALAREARSRHPDATLLLAARNTDRVDDPGGESESLAIDVADEASVAAAGQNLLGRGICLDLCLVATGILHAGDDVQPEKKVEDLNATALAKVFSTNAIGPMLIARHFLPLLSHDRPATLAFLAARVGSIGDNRLGGWYAYRASKAALVMFNRTLAHELGRRAKNVTSVCLHPGTVDSDLSSPFQRRLPDGQVVSPDEAAGNLWNVIEGLKPEHHGHQLAWDGSVVPW